MIPQIELDFIDYLLKEHDFSINVLRTLIVKKENGEYFLSQIQAAYINFKAGWECRDKKKPQ